MLILSSDRFLKFWIYFIRSSAIQTRIDSFAVIPRFNKFKNCIISICVISIFFKFTSSFFKTEWNDSIHELSYGQPFRLYECRIFNSAKYSSKVLLVYWIPKSVCKIIPSFFLTFRITFFNAFFASSASIVFPKAQIYYFSWIQIFYWC